MPKVELTNMVMIEDPATGRVVVEDRVKSWKGLSFPGGHVEEGESFVDSAVREVWEETGLTVRDLSSCGVIHWCNRATGDRYLVFLYRTRDFSGALLPETDEGRVFWIDPREIPSFPSENEFRRYLPMFFEGQYSEAFGIDGDGDFPDIQYK